MMGAMLCVGLALGLAACGDDDEKDAAQAGSASGSSSSSTSSPETSPGTKEADKDADDAADTSGAGCLVGTWLLDNAHFGALLKGAAGEASGSMKMSEISGKMLMTFTDKGQFNATYKGSSFDITQDGMTIKMVREGTDKGTYQAKDDGHLEISETDMGSVVKMTSQGGSHSISSPPSSTTSTFICKGNTLKVTAEGATSILSRQ